VQGEGLKKRLDIESENFENMSISSSEITNSSDISDTSDMDINMDLQNGLLYGLGAVISTSIKTQKKYSKSFLSNYHLKLVNEKNSCYCNSVIQALLSLNAKVLTRVS